MMILIATKYCPKCRQKEKHIVIIQKADLQGYTLSTRWICLSIYCNYKETILMTLEQAQRLVEKEEYDGQNQTSH